MGKSDGANAWAFNAKRNTDATGPKLPRDAKLGLYVPVLVSELMCFRANTVREVSS